MVNASEMIFRLRDLVEIESPTYSPGVRRVAKRVAGELEQRGGRVSFLEHDHVRADFPGEGPRLLLLGHTDTVWPEGTLQAMPVRVEGRRGAGPGVSHMKGWLVLVVA